MNITLDQWAGVGLGQFWLWCWCVHQDQIAFAAIAGMTGAILMGEVMGLPFEVYKES